MQKFLYSYLRIYKIKYYKYLYYSMNIKKYKSYTYEHKL